MNHNPRWPEHSRICGYSGKKVLLFKSSDRNLDLHDSFLCTFFSNQEPPFFLSVTTDNQDWELLDEDDGYWDETALRMIEKAIKDDFAYDDVIAEPRRIAGEGWPRSCSAIWELHLFDSDDDD